MPFQTKANGKWKMTPKRAAFYARISEQYKAHPELSQLPQIRERAIARLKEQHPLLNSAYVLPKTSTPQAHEPAYLPEIQRCLSLVERCVTLIETAIVRGV